MLIPRNGHDASGIPLAARPTTTMHIERSLRIRTLTLVKPPRTRRHSAPTGMQLAVGLILCAIGTAAAMAADAGSAAALRASYAAQQPEIEKNKFGEPLTLQSRETSNTLQGDIYALIDQPFARGQGALAEPKSWCDILILHPNVKRCRLNAVDAGGAPSMTVNLGRAELAVQFSYKADVKTADYLDVRLDSPTGPFGTTDYRIRLEAAPMDAQHTILHLAYSHGYGLRAKLAMQAYFNTLARGKVGFTVVDRDAQGRPVYVSGLRGGLERNAMRYYASIESYLDSLATPAQQQLERRLRHWYVYTERYPLQLQEEPGYLDVKRKEAQRAQSQG
ncbi:MAG: hypothetical protein JWN13_2063 [Betaproteobacteria bacterium]|nr:hypothetical protein [Betaproteobacteria bacterium]